jgi:hypothetical protein
MLDARQVIEIAPQLIASISVAFHKTKYVLKPRILRADTCERGPIAVALTLREAGQKMIADHAGDGQWHIKTLSGGKRELDVFQTQRHLEPGRFIVLVCDDRAIGIVDRGREQGAGQDFDKAMRVDPRFAGKRDGFPQTLNGRRRAHRSTSLAQGLFGDIIPLVA